MDISEINKLANRKRLKEDAEKLREKVSRETAKIIKLKVSQDTAYWELKEKFNQLVNNHENLQQNILKVQMQYETVSEQYQDELRFRPETLNKVLSTRKICDVLENYSEKLKETLSKCKIDQATLCDAYDKSKQFLTDTKMKQVQQEEKYRTIIANLEEKFKMMVHYKDQLIGSCNVARSQTECELNATKTMLSAAQGKNDELHSAVNELNTSLNKCQHELEKKTESISSLQNDKNLMRTEFNTQIADMKRTLEQKEMDLKESLAANESLKQALSNQEEFIKSKSEQNNVLQENISALEKERLALINTVEDLKIGLEGATSTNIDLSRDLTNITEEKQDLLKTVGDKSDLIANLESELVTLKAEISTLDAEKLKIMSELNETRNERDKNATVIDHMMATGRELEDRIEKINQAVEDIRVEKEEEVKKLTITIESKDKELDCKASTINELMSKVKTGADTCSTLESTLSKLKEDMEGERKASKDREAILVKQMENLSIVVKNQEDDLSKQVSIIRETRNENERLQEKINQMQVTINNIQKELIKQPAQPPSEQPEHDDNHMRLSPVNDETRPSPPKLQKTSKYTISRVNPEDMLYHIFSDTSNGEDVEQAAKRDYNNWTRVKQPPRKPMTAAAKPRDGAAQRNDNADCDKRPPKSGYEIDALNKPRHFFKTKRPIRKI